MTQSNFEKNGGTYTQIGDYLIPDLTLPPEEQNIHIGVYGMRRSSHEILRHLYPLDILYIIYNALHTSCFFTENSSNPTPAKTYCKIRCFLIYNNFGIVTAICL